MTIEVTRRTLLLTGTAIGLGAAVTRTAPFADPARAEAAMTTIDLGGGFSVQTITDGYLTLPSDFPAPAVEAQARKAAMAAAGQEGDTYRSPINVVLVTTPDDKILVDVGSGAHFMSTAGKFVANLEDAGFSREDITKVVYTHAHPDHIWGTLDEFDELTFPEASFHMSEAEHAYWSNEKTIDTLPEDRKAFAVGAKRQIDTLGDKLERHPAGFEVASGVTLVDTAGHTPGHTSVLVTSGDKSFMVLGDALTHPVISFKHPDWQPGADHIKDMAVETRKRLLDQLATDGIPFTAYHLPGGGMGRAEKNGDGYAFVPLS